MTTDAFRALDAVAPGAALDVSVIIPTWNNCQRLAVTLDAIARCWVPDGLGWEVIVVANACSDDTPAVVAGYGGKLPLRSIEEPRPGVCRTRNAGIAHARGRLLIFGDDDIRPFTNWIVAYWEGFGEHGDRRYLFGPLRSEFEAEPPDPVLLQLAHFAVGGLDHGPNQRDRGPESMFAEANWACPRDVLRRAGGFNPDLGLDSSLGHRRTGEAFDLAIRLHALGLCGRYLPNAGVHHFVPQHKCTLRHLGEAQRARGASYVRSPRPHHLLERQPWLKARLGRNESSVGEVFRVLWLLGWSWSRWVSARFGGRSGHVEFLSWQFCLGMLDRHLQVTRARLFTRRPDA